MFEQECVLFDFVLDYCRRLMADISDDELSVQPVAGVHPPLWVLGHLAIALDFALKLLGRPLYCPKEWHTRFGPRSDDAEKWDRPPSRDELLQAIAAGHAAVRAGIASADPAAMRKPHGLNLLPDIPLHTVGDFLAHIMTTHFATHLGQLSVWRRVTGRPPLF